MNLPLQSAPLPSYPELHWQAKLPSVLLQVACKWQPPPLIKHSLTSEILCQVLFVHLDRNRQNLWTELNLPHGLESRYSSLTPMDLPLLATYRASVQLHLAHIRLVDQFSLDPSSAISDNYPDTIELTVTYYGHTLSSQPINMDWTNKLIRSCHVGEIMLVSEHHSAQSSKFATVCISMTLT